MANSALILSSLDFNTLKTQLEQYLTSQDTLQDYNFNSAALNVLLDALSYNTYLNSFYLNMVLSEMFLDSAQKLNSAVSRAKELNYLPTSAASSEANISFTVVTNGISNPFVIPAGTLFSGTNANGNYTFSTSADQSFVSSNSTYQVSNLQIFEGQYITDSFVIDATSEQQIFLLSNPGIDVSSLTVTVFENSSNTSNTGVEYARALNLYGLNANSEVYFVQGAQDGQYEVVFGDGLLGYVPFNGSLVTASYRVASGNTADGISSFVTIQNLGAFNGGTASISGPIVVIVNSSGGTSQESLNSIKFNAPRFYATQERAVASDDFKSLIMAQFSGEISDVNTYGGEQLNPKKYGFVAACLKPTGSSSVAPDYIKSNVINYLISLDCVPIRVIVTDPNYFFIGVTSNVTFSPMSTSLTSADLQTLVLDTITEYSANNLQKFNGDFRYSKFIAAIDDTDPSIISNDTTALMIKRLSPQINIDFQTTIDFNNAIQTPSHQYEISKLPLGSAQPVVFSTAFTYVNPQGNTFPNSIIRDDNYGNLIIYSKNSGIVTNINDSVGTVNYSNGVISLNIIQVSQYVGSYISLYAQLQNDDIVIEQDQILTIDPNDVIISINTGTS
jgi:hypothetical protein